MYKNILLNKAIFDIRKLAKELIEISGLKKQKYPFREEHLNLIISKWKENPGKYLIHLLDLPGHFIVRFNANGKKILGKTQQFIKRNYGLDSVKRKYDVNFYLIGEQRSDGLTVASIRKYLSFLPQLNISQLEENVVSILPGARSELMKLPKGLPIDLRKENWAFIFGILPDTYLKKFKFASEDPIFANEIKEKINRLGVKPNIQSKSNMTYIKGHSIMSHIIEEGGISIKKRQLLANNCLPYWIFLVSEKYHAILLSKFFDTEGHICSRKGLIRIAQATNIALLKEEKEFVMRNCKHTVIRPSGAKSDVIIFSKLNRTLQEKVLSKPPLILISIQLLLRKYKINSILYPTNIYISNNGVVSSSWQLSIHNFRNIEKFYRLCGSYISVKYKKEGIERYLLNKEGICLPMGLRKLNFLVYASDIEKKKGFFTTKDLIMIQKRKRKTAFNDVGYMAKEGYVKTKDKINHTKLRILTKKGREYLKKNKLLDKETWESLVI